MAERSARDSVEKPDSCPFCQEETIRIHGRHKLKAGEDVVRFKCASCERTWQDNNVRDRAINDAASIDLIFYWINAKKLPEKDVQLLYTTLKKRYEIL